MKYFTLFLNILCLKWCVSILPNNDLQMIVDLANSYEKPTAIVANVCWNSKADEVKLSKMLTNLERPITVRYLRKNKTFANSYPNNHLLLLLDKNCVDAEFFLKQANANKMFSKSYRWLVLGNPIQKESIVPPEFRGLNISVDSEVIMAQKTANNDTLLHTIYKIRPKSEWNIEYYGVWSADYGLNKSDKTIQSNVMRRKDFKGEPLTASSVVEDKRTTLSDLITLRHILVDTVAKSTFRSINPLFDFLNASRRILFNDTWGYKVNGTWNGMIGEINTGKAELCGMVTFMSLERLKILEYFTNPTPVTVKIVFRKPPLSYQNNLFLLPFTTGVWICLGAFVLIMIVVLYINTKWDIKKYEQFNEQNMDQTCLPPTWSDITIFVLSAISQQGSSNELKGTLGRLVMFIVFLAFLFLYTSYSANIVALLQSTSNQIRTLSDLLNSKLELGVEDVPYNRYYFSPAQSASDPIKKAIYETKVAPRGKPNFLTLEEGVKAMQKRPFAFNMNTGTGYRIVSALFQEHEKCGLHEIEYYQNAKAWLCSGKNSPFGEMFKVGYIRIQEHGLTDRENRLAYAKKPVCSVMGSSFDSVNMVDFYPVCLMLLYGMILAFVLLVIEILAHRHQMKKHNQEPDVTQLQ
ncbi:hypothetical protein B5X24_HaOG200843 [Helicoverpa armigera]|nr:hypothetical protein B5X24_HaOG200843 [Helicoverpa armigera]